MLWLMTETGNLVIAVPAVEARSGLIVAGIDLASSIDSTLLSMPAASNVMGGF